MNLILLYPTEIDVSGKAVISALMPNNKADRRFTHISKVQKPKVGDSLKVGVIDGKKGLGKVLSIDSNQLVLATHLDQSSPAPLALTLILALPRPKMLKRTLETLATMGAKDIYFINSYRVDKSYWSTPLLQDAAIEEHLLLGLEQAGDTLLPKVHLRKRFKPFVEDELPEIAHHTRALVAHPYNASPCPQATTEATTLAIGPEGGFIEYEVEKLNEAGLTPIHIGERILRVETAVPVLLAKLFP